MRDDDVTESADALLAAAMALAGRRVAVLTGAGVSTDSGIPDYRGEGTRQRARRPVRFAEFIASPYARKRYWARAFVGWPRIRDARPNATHDVVAGLIRGGRASGCITQNVDGLHQTAGADPVVELHGALRLVRCLRCQRVVEREALQLDLAARNPRWSASTEDAAPDGDVDLDDDAIEEFVVVDCACGGDFKPAVVFFGENVAADVLAHAWRVFDDASALLVLGTSLEVFSGRRFVIEAHKRRLPIVLVTKGKTRADDLVTVKVDGSVAEAVAALA